MDKKKLREALEFEISRHIPFSSEEVYFDFFVLKEISPSEVLLLLAVAKKEFINQLLDIFEKENLKVLEINLDSICLLNFFLFAYKEEKEINSCLLDLGYSASTLTILDKGIPFLTRDLGVNVKSMMEVISHTKGLPLSEIDSWLASSHNQEEFLRLVEDSISNLNKEIKNSFDYFEVNKGERIEKMYLTGGLTSLEGITNFFKEALNVEVLVLDIFKNLNFSFSDEKFTLYKNNFTITAGLML
jgi:type IV pilus assembly protein PilM